MITIVDYGLGNLGSVQNMLTKLGESSVITSDANIISNASKLILPGVGSFDTGINKIRELGLESVLNQMALNKKIPVLGICLGAQLMTNSSEEGVEKGFGWFDAETKKFNHSGIIGKWPLPNIGWRDIKNNKDYPLLDGIKRLPRFYFVHSYVLTPNDDSIISMRSEYGYDFACGLHRDNLHCVQFHPEKSHSFGFKFMNNFINI